MASKSATVWAIDIGSNSIKALHLSASDDVVEVIGFDNIQHGKILTGSGIEDAEKDELIALSLHRLVTQKDLGKDGIVVSVAGQNSFFRFVNLPPVEAKRIPEIVKFEAAQQIPFDINDVQWDWQMMSKPDDTEKKVGIFAIKNEVVTSAIEHFSRENIRVGYVQMAPMALYNYLLYDRPDLIKSDNQATIILNIGAENTDLVVCTKSAVWQRCIPMGGNTFTKAIADAFRLNFEKAEKLKRTAPMSKYARQILQAMKPVFADLASEIQRSLGFYGNSNPNTKLSKIIALGGGTKMRGLLKYLQQTLQIPIERPDAFDKLKIGSGVSAAKFHDSVTDFGVVYGLALQGLGRARIESNLLPRSVARSMAWTAKAKYFNAAALLLLVVTFMCLGRTIFDKVNYSNKMGKRQEVRSVIKAADQANSKLRTQEGKSESFEKIIQKEFEPFKYRNVVPQLYQTIILVLPNEKNNPEQQELYRAFAKGDVETILKIPRKDRKQVFITNISASFVKYIEAAEFGAEGFQIQRIRRRGRPMQEVDDGEGGFGFGFRGGPASVVRRSGGPSAPREGEEKAGFVVTISGYSPYKNIGELMDPAGVKDAQSKWGVITRLMHLDDITDGNTPFELYKKTEVKHFKLEIGEVSVDAKMPGGIGVQHLGFQSQTGQKILRSSGADAELFLLDPMTREVISKVVDFDKYGRKRVNRLGEVVYKPNDYWFVLNIKLVWKDIPVEASG